MSIEFSHTPVLMQPILKAAAALSRIETMIDCTLGGAGHAAALLQMFDTAHLIGLDRDREALAVAQQRLQVFGSRVQTAHAPFSQVKRVLSEMGQGEGVDLLLADLGVSSYQLDNAERGFSFRDDAPLDMRMDTTSGQSVAELLADIEAEPLADILWKWGEERASRPIARAIVKSRPRRTWELKEAVYRVLGRKHDQKIDPATRTFQALRIAVNEELQELETLLSALPTIIKPGGLAMIISFHSLEDRMVKQAFRLASSHCICPPAFPVCACTHRATFKVLTSQPRPALAYNI